MRFTIPAAGKRWMYCAGSRSSLRLPRGPVVDATHERRNQEHTRISTRRSLSEGEQQGQVGLNAFLFQNLGGTDAFPGGSDLDQYAVAADAGFVVQLDQTVRALQYGVSVERKARVHFSGNAARDHFQNFLTYRNAKTVARQAHIAVAVVNAGVQQLGITGNGGRFEQQGRVGGSVHGFYASDCFEVAGVGNDGSDLFELFQLGSHGRALSYGSDDITRALTATQGRVCVSMAPAATSAKRVFEWRGAVSVNTMPNQTTGSTQLTVSGN